MATCYTVAKIGMTHKLREQLVVRFKQSDSCTWSDSPLIAAVPFPVFSSSANAMQSVSAFYKVKASLC